VGWKSTFSRPVAHMSCVVLLVVGSVASAHATLPQPRTHAAPAPRWAGTWETAMATGVSDGCVDCTIRDVIHTSAGGTAVRVRLSNAFGAAPLTVGHTTVAVPAVPGRADVAPGTLRQVRFGGAAAVTIAPGAEAVSDPVTMTAPAGADLLVTTYTPGPAASMSYHAIGLQRSFLARGADAADAGTATAFTGATYSRHLVSGLDVEGPPGTIVAFGDSITDGWQSSGDANRRWPDVLAARLQGGPRSRRFGVLNAGIGGNRVLLGGRKGIHGQAATRRLDRDVLSRPGVRTVIVLEGINDIQQRPHQLDPARITAGLADIAARSRAHGLRVIGGTLTPFAGCACYSPEEEVTRQAVNDWIRGSGTFDAVTDFDAALRDPDDPHRMLPDYDSGDHLHPGDAGYEAMGNAVDLSAL
jgi:lysophospholipase L1-like esterase